MKTIFQIHFLIATGILLFGATRTVQAEDVILDSKKIQLRSDDVQLIRVADSPDRITLEMPVQMGHLVCTEYGTELRSGYDAFHCGYTQGVRVRCTYDHRRCHNEVVNVPRYCTWEESVCVARSPQYTPTMRKVILKFKDMPALGASEMETYELRGMQNHFGGNDATFDMRAIGMENPVKINEKDNICTGFKDVVVVKPQ